MLDLQKAFDTVDHHILCQKLKYMGVGNIDWFHSYLTLREQSITVNGTDSSTGSNNCVVLRGGIFGLVFFLCYLNDMLVSIKCRLIVYLGDSALLVLGNVTSKIV